MKKELKDISSIYDDLDQIRAKTKFMNSAILSYQEDIKRGCVELESDFIYGQTLINCELETAFEEALKALETFCKVAK